jgi:ABC-type transport system involved in cytochrome c biogenesis permease subunit
MIEFTKHVTMVCFAASYLLALGLEAWALLRPRPILRLVSAGCVLAGLFAHTLFLVNAFFLAEQQPLLSSPYGSLLFLSWILAVFAVAGDLHHRRVAWGLFVLPLVLVLIGLAKVLPLNDRDVSFGGWWQGEQVWGTVHGVLLILAFVGACVGFLASVMYLVQAHRLRAKVPPGKGLKLLSLERLEQMNRRAITLTFPLLTAGVLVGLGQLLQHPASLTFPPDLKIVGAVGGWLVLGLLLYLRIGAHLRGRSVAQLTIVAFVLLLGSLVASHSVIGQGVGQ